MNESSQTTPAGAAEPPSAVPAPCPFPVMTPEEEREFWAAVTTVRAFRRSFEEAEKAGRTLSKADEDAFWDAAWDAAFKSGQPLHEAGFQAVAEPGPEAGR